MNCGRATGATNLSVKIKFHVKNGGEITKILTFQRSHSCPHSRCRNLNDSLKLMFLQWVVQIRVVPAEPDSTNPATAVPPASIYFDLCSVIFSTNPFLMWSPIRGNVTVATHRARTNYHEMKRSPAVIYFDRFAVEAFLILNLLYLKRDILCKLVISSGLIMY